MRQHYMFYPRHHVLDDMINQFFGDAFKIKDISKYPLTDVYEENGRAFMEVAVSGFTKEEIQVILENDSLTVRGTKVEQETPERNYIKRDIAKRNFEKTYNLMFPIDSVNASINDGILKIELLPKIEQRDTKYIEIK